MARLHRIAYRIVWANPRTQSERYRPEVGGMAAAWPYCDAVVSAHNFEALDDLLAALRAPRVHRPSFVPPSPGSPADGGTAPGDRPGVRACAFAAGHPEPGPALVTLALLELAEGPRGEGLFSTLL